MSDRVGLGSFLGPAVIDLGRRQEWVTEPSGPEAHGAGPSANVDGKVIVHDFWGSVNSLWTLATHSVSVGVLASVAAGIGGALVSWFLSGRQHRYRLREQEHAFAQRLDEERRKWRHESEVRHEERERAQVEKCIVALSGLADAAEMIRLAVHYLSSRSLSDALEMHQQAAAKAKSATFALTVARHAYCEHWWDEVDSEFDNIRAMVEDHLAEDQTLENQEKIGEVGVAGGQCLRPPIDGIDKAIRRLRKRAAQLNRRLERDRG